MRKMRRPVVITAPWGTPEETARLYGIPKRRAAELKRMVEESLAKKGFITFDEGKSPSTKNGPSNGASGSRGLKKKARVNIRESKSGNASRRKTTRAKAKISR
jgi:hypothetical protein